jgi:hypothetical protein
MLCFFVSDSKAQCPDSTWSPLPNPHWASTWMEDSTHQQIPGTNCWEWIYYCHNEWGGGPIPDTEEFWITKVKVDTTTDCDSIDPVLAIGAAQTLVYNDPIINKFYSCNKVLPLTVQAFVGLCWESLNLPTGKIYFPCGVGWCDEECDVCVDVNHVVHIKNCSWQSSTSESCTTIPPTYPDRWANYICYYIDICGVQRKVNPESSVGTNQSAYHELATLTPNPARDEVLCSWSGSAREIQLFDVLGNIVRKIPVSSTTVDIQIALKGLASGSYYLRISYLDGAVQTYKLVKSEH